MDRIKIQHYVPRFYLRNFARQDGSVFFTTCFDKSTQQSFATNIDKIGAEKYFYDSDGDRSQLIERQLGRFETSFNEAYTSLIKRQQIKALSPEQLNSLAYFIAVQEVRTREFREGIEDMARQLHKRLSADRLSTELRRSLESMKGAEFSKEFQLDFMIEKVPNLAAIIRNLKWVLLVNETGKPYWTSDHPVNRYNSVNLAPFGNLGLLSPGIEIYFPLTTHLALCVCDPVIFGQLPDHNELEDEQNIVFQNGLQVRSSTRHIFSTDNDFSLAKQMLTEIPELSNIKRQRVSVE